MAIGPSTAHWIPIDAALSVPGRVLSAIGFFASPPAGGFFHFLFRLASVAFGFGIFFGFEFGSDGRQLGFRFGIGFCLKLVEQEGLDGIVHKACSFFLPQMRSKK
jgi:hypothetical protein